MPTRPSETVYWPAISLCAFSTHEEFFAAIGSGDLPNGFVNRLLVFSTKYRAPETIPTVDLIVATSLETDLQAVFHWRDPDGLNAPRLVDPQFDPPPDVLQWSDDRAKTNFLKFQRYNEKPYRKPGLEHFTGRGAEIAIRIATIRAVGREPGNYDVRVSAEDFQWAAELVRIAGDILVKEAPAEMEADLTRGEMAKKIIATRQKRGGETTGRVISRALPMSATTRDVDDVLKTLVDRGTISRSQRPCYRMGRRKTRTE